MTTTMFSTSRPSLKALKHLSLTSLPADAEDCAICTGTDPYDSGAHSPVQLTYKCTHIFGLSCLKDWVIRRNKNTCPICRQAVFNPFGQNLVPYNHVDPIQVSERNYPPTRYARPRDAQMLAEKASKRIFGRRGIDGVQGLPRGFLETVENKAYDVVSYIMRNRGKAYFDHEKRVGMVFKTEDAPWHMAYIKTRMTEELQKVLDRYVKAEDVFEVKDLSTGVKAEVDRSDAEDIAASYVNFIVVSLCEEALAERVCGHTEVTSDCCFSGRSYKNSG